MRQASTLGSFSLVVLQSIVFHSRFGHPFRDVGTPPRKAHSVHPTFSTLTKLFENPKMSPADAPAAFSERIEWKVRPATMEDESAVNALLMDSYENLLAANYDADFLKTALPLITKGREELLTCGTWYVVEDPRDGSLTGCGGWTVRQPAKAEGGAKVPHLRHFATRSDLARKGIGKAIWNRSWEDIVKQSAEGADTPLEVFSTLTAEPFYASVGFQKVKELTLPIAEGCDFPCTLMRRDPRKI